MPTTTLTAPRLVLVRMAEADDTPDEVLVKRAQGGDRAALDRLVRRHQRALFALCLRYVRDADEAADLVQRSFVRAMGKLADLRDAGVFRSWLLRIGAHLALNHIRDHARFVAGRSEQDERDWRRRPRGRRRRPRWTGWRPPRPPRRCARRSTSCRPNSG